MTNIPPLSAEEQIEYLARKVLGWTAGLVSWNDEDYKSMADKLDWNPLENWSDWRQCEEKMMKNEDLLNKFVLSISTATDAHDAVIVFMTIDLPTRISALISAHQELYDN